MTNVGSSNGILPLIPASPTRGEGENGACGRGFALLTIPW